ncbi:TRAP transporter permease [Amorphus orientalis]|uniref:TRAP transporter 4TM/12TM fusion protein n=1 Tax=Amorphus orientalis TaxID=649198 RepID=A0AAE3VR60_9HYPH|nr:TRAP transporter permease [Amorphus orientalis]MDQ0316817.1 TRAP transporter 4TM/12TM fusion protein [Amorphus orientalis]
MTAEQTAHRVDAESLVAATDTGARSPVGWQRWLIPGIAFIWALFQLYVASPLPFIFAQALDLPLVLNNTEIRIVHLAFALVLAAFAYPLFKSASRHSIPWYDWILAALGAASCLYLFVFKDQIADRAGLPTDWDLIMSTIGMIMLGVAVFRSLGLPLLIVASIFVLYVFFGSADWIPGTLQWKGASYGKAMWHYWMQTEGVFGVALGVSATMIFLFVMFGAILEKAGAGNFFIKIAFALLGHLRGGPAKAAVVASAMSGLYSGSSIANTVTTGTFTIPLMKKTGFPPEKAGAVEVASSTNGQLTPPVMGAAAFLISEFTGTPYTELIKNALLPALISYIALVYIVHLEALKLGLAGMKRPPAHMRLMGRLIGFLTGFLGLAVLAGLVYYGLGWVREAFPGMGLWAASLIFLVAYVVLLWVASQRPDLKVDDPNAPIEELPRPGAVAVTGLYFLLPIVILIWCIMIERLSPATSAFYATVAMIFIALTQHPLKALFRGTGNFGFEAARGVQEWMAGMIAGSRNMIAIAVATGAAGVIVGTISLTGAHQVIGEFVEYVSGGQLMVMLVLVAIMSLILGMGLPTTANYIVVSSLMAPVIVTLGAQQGLIVPLVAVHLFVFYFGILADDTPPVGLAAFAAAAISGGDPIKTGIQGFTYDIRTALLPFMFLFNTQLLLIDVGPFEAIVVFIVAVIAMLLFAAATQRYLLAPMRWWEVVAVLLVSFTLFRPGFWLDQVQAPYDLSPGTQATEVAGSLPAGAQLRMTIEGTDFTNPDERVTKTFMVPLGEPGPGAERLDREGLTLFEDGDQVTLDEPFPGTPHFRLAQELDFYADEPVVIESVGVAAERMPKEIFYIPAFLVLLVVLWSQRRRQTVPAF